MPGTHFYRNIRRFENVDERPDLLIFRYDAQLYFANVNYFKEQLEQMMTLKGEELKLIILNSESINYLDSSGAHALEEIVDDLRGRDLDLFFTGVRGPVRDALKRGKLIQKIGQNNFFMNVQDAVDYYDQMKHNGERDRLSSYILQTNVGRKGQ